MSKRVQHSRPNRSPVGETVSSIKHPAVLAARRGLGQLGGAEPVSYLVEGHNMARQALASGQDVEAVFLRAPADTPSDAMVCEQAATRAVPCFAVSRGVFVRIHDLGYETSVTALAVVRRRTLDEIVYPSDDHDCLLVGERIQDPKNVGTLIRTCDAWGVTAFALTADSADPFSRGSVRSSTGSVLRLPLARVANLQDYLRRLKDRSVRIVGTSARGDTVLWDADLTGPCAIVLGNESVGLSASVRTTCDEVVTIPMCGGAHSFNVAVAAGIVLYERMRQQGEGR